MPTSIIDLVIDPAASPSPHNMSHTMKLKAGGSPNVREEPPSSPTTSGRKLHVKGGSETLRFVVTATSGPAWHPTGVMFVEMNTGLPVGFAPVDPSSPFSGLKLNGNTVEFTDQYAHTSVVANQKPRLYKFSVIVQRHGDKETGIIDPEIENNDAT